MPQKPPTISPDLALKIRRVELQYRQRRWMRAWTQFGAVTLVLLVGFTLLLYFGMQWDLKRPVLLTLFGAAEAVAAWFLLIRPLTRPVTRRQIAMLIDEQYPELENRIVSAVEFGAAEYSGPSVYLIEKFLEDTRDRVRRIRFADLVDAEAFLGSFAFVALLWMLSALVVLFFHNLWIPEWSLSGGAGAPGVSASTFTVEPGNARVRAGDHQVIVVKSDLTGRKVAITWKTDQGTWQTAEMKQGSSEQVHYHQFSSVVTDIDYRVRFGYQNSEDFKLTTWTPPEVRSVDLTYRYPEYLGLPPREVPNSGNITAVEGSDVTLRVNVNKRLKSAELVFDSGERVPLEEETESLWMGTIKVTENDKYEIALVDHEEAPSEFNPKYTVAVQQDKAPVVKIDFPRGDSEVTSIEEVPFDFSVSDDFGLSDYGLQYEVAGAEAPVRIPLGEKGVSAEEARGHFEMMLEEMTLTAGDLITWTVYAKDRKPDREEYEELGDPFFLEIRPFERMFSEAISNQGGGIQGGGGMESQEASSQKEILIATWNLRRKADKLEPAEYEEQKKTILEAQVKLMQQFEGGGMMMGGGGGGDTKEITEAMKGAVRSIERAELPEPAGDLSEATVYQQRAYRAILKQTPNRTEVQQMQGGGGGGGGQRPELNDLELDRNKNFYEEESRTQNQQQQAADEALSKIKELAQRQKMVNDEIAKLISEMNKAKTEEERRELERQLERLREEEQKILERLDEIQSEVAQSEMDPRQARQTRESLDEAREQMNRSLENLQDGQMQQARSASSRALSSLNEIEEKLQSLSRQAAAEKMRGLQEQMEQLQEKENNLVQDLAEVKEGQDTPGLTGEKTAEAQREELMDQKRELMEQYAELMEQASELAERSAQSQELMSRKLGDWLRQTTREGIYEDMDKGKQLLQYGIYDSAVQQEQAIEKKLADAAKGLEEVANNMVEDDLEGMQRALENLEQILDEQKQEQNIADAGQQDQQPGQQQGQQGQQFQEGQQPGQQGARPGEQEGQQAGGPRDPQGREMRGFEPGMEPGQREGQGRQPGEQEREGQQGQGRRPGEQQEGQQGQQQGEQEGQQPGQQQGDQQGQQSGEQGQQPGRQPGEQGQSGQQQGQQQGQQGQQGGQPGSQQGQGQQQGEPSDQSGQQSGSQGRGSRAQNDMRDQSSRSGPGGRGAARNWSNADWGPRDMREFIEQDYQGWLENIRDAEALLPADSPYRRDLERIRFQIEEMRRDYRRHSLTPQFDLFLQAVGNPLASTADQLSAEIAKLLKEKEFVLTDDGSIPSNYRKPVAQYFKSLSESETR